MSEEHDLYYMSDDGLYKLTPAMEVVKVGRFATKREIFKYWMTRIFRVRRA